MEDAIKNFAQQFAYEPKIENAARLKKHKRFIVVGMGGSNLATDLVQLGNPELDIVTHRNYGLPRVPRSFFSKPLAVLSSHSGNTEEVLGAYEEAKKQKLPMAAITTDGELLSRAKADGIPYVAIPAEGIQPRMALGYQVRALLALMGDRDNLEATKGLTFDMATLEAAGRALTETLNGRVPIIYASEKNAVLAYNWKVKFNETGKIPAFWNVFPEANHNEMTGFDSNEKTKTLADHFHAIFLHDSEDHPRIIKRMELTADLYKKRGIKIEEFRLEGKTLWEAMFNLLLIADWASYHTARMNGADPEKVPMVEEFKKMMK